MSGLLPGGNLPCTVVPSEASTASAEGFLAERGARRNRPERREWERLVARYRAACYQVESLATAQLDDFYDAVAECPTCGWMQVFFVERWESTPTANLLRAARAADEHNRTRHARRLARQEGRLA